MKFGFSAIAIGLMLAGASASAAEEKLEGKLLEKAVQEARSMPRPGESLAAFSTLEIEPLLLSNEVRKDKKRSKWAAAFEHRLQPELESAAAAWKARGQGGDRKLVLQPILLRFTVNSNMATFLGGGYSGSPQISLALSLKDGSDGRLIANPIITQTELAVFGIEMFESKNDELMAFVATIAREYMLNRMSETAEAR